MTEVVDGQVGWFGQDTWSGRTCPEPSAQESQREQTSQRSSKRSSKSASRGPMCVCLSRTTDGQRPGAITLTMAPGALLGEFTTHSFGECPREENASRLSQILEDSAPQKYSLSARACEGILRRAERRGKELPKELKMALEAQSAFKNVQENQGGAKDCSYSMNTSEPCLPSTTRAYSIQGNTIDRDVKQNGGGYLP